MKKILLALMLLPLVSFAEGVSVRGGANSVGDKLYDDYENEDVVLLKPKQVLAIVAPLFREIEKKIPGRSKGNWGVDYYSRYGLNGNEELLEMLSYGFDGIKWYLEPKELKQHGRCQNQTVLAVKKVVRACQSELAVRIDKKFFQENSDVQVALILHELLVYVQLNKYNSSITDEGVREASRALRDPKISQADLKETLDRTGFGSYTTAEELAETARNQKSFAAACAKDPQFSCSCPGYQKSGVFIWGLGTVGQSEKEKWCH